MLYLGIDLHSKQLTVSLRNEAGDVVVRRQVSTRPAKVEEFLKQVHALEDGKSVAYRCFVCGSQGNALDLWAAVHGLSLHAAAENLCATMGIEIPWITRW